MTFHTTGPTVGPTVGLSGLSTWCRDVSLGPEAFVARVRALGIAQLAADATLASDELSVLVPEALRAGLTFVAFEAPCPRPAGPRAPDLASADPEERLAAARALEETFARAAEAAARIVVVRLGSLPGHDDRPILRAFARRDLDDEVVRKQVEIRRALSLRALDLARFGLDRVLDTAAAAGITLGLANRARWYDIPSAGEVATLLGDLAGAPLAPFYDAAAAHVRRTLGFGNGRPEVELEKACGAYLTDACGVRVGLPWGTGEVDREAVLAALPKDAPRIRHCGPMATDEELLAG